MYYCAFKTAWSTLKPVILAEFLTGANRQVLNYLHEAESLAESLGDAYRLAQISYNIADGYRIRGGYERARLAAQRALSLAEALEDRSLQIEARAVMGQIHYYLGDYGQAIELLQRTLTDLADAPTPGRDDAPDALPVWQQSWLLLCLAQVGAFQTGQTISVDVRHMAETTNHPFNLSVAAYGVGMLFLRQGELLQAISVLERGLALYRASEIKDWLPTLAAGLGYAYALVDRLPEALPLLEQAMEQYSAMRGGVLYPVVMVMQSEAMLLAGRREDATAICRRALGLARHSQERGSEAYALRLLGEIAAHSEPLEADQAEAYYRQGLTLAEEKGMRPLQAHCHLGLGSLYATTDQRQQARAELSKAIEMYRAMDMTFIRSEANERAAL
jgi:tetratricopeptide (TPR) repeat protein